MIITKKTTAAQSESAYPQTYEEKNAYVVCFLSGKGGVGKTSLAINIAKATSIYKKRVLLIDCDLNTCGATAFFRLYQDTKEPIRDNSPIDFQEIMSLIMDHVEMENPQADATGANDRLKQEYQKRVENNGILNVNQYFSFIPGKLGNDLFHEEELNEKAKAEEAAEKLQTLFGLWRSEYDLILVDCGAGYGTLNSMIVNNVDKICVVMENTEISHEATKRALARLFSSVDICSIIGCYNKNRNKKDESPRVGIMREVTGLSESEPFAALYESGRMLDYEYEAITGQLMRLAAAILADRTELLIEINGDIKRIDYILEGEAERKRKKKYIIRLSVIMGTIATAAIPIITVIAYYNLWDRYPPANVTVALAAAVAAGLILSKIDVIINRFRKKSNKRR